MRELVSAMNSCTWAESVSTDAIFRRIVLFSSRLGNHRLCTEFSLNAPGVSGQCRRTRYPQAIDAIVMRQRVVIS